MIASRRGFLLGALAAPTIISIDGKMKFFMPPKPGFVIADHMTSTTPFFRHLIVNPEFEQLVAEMLNRRFAEVGL